MWILVAAWIWSMATSYHVTEINDLVNKTKSKCMPPVMVGSTHHYHEDKQLEVPIIQVNDKGELEKDAIPNTQTQAKSILILVVVSGPFEKKDRFQLMHIRLLRRTLKCGSQFY
ncbi:hypothetical protein NC653_032056 [Populus alba x Populus x berolinensis]|uniref:Secreted protein n=1 Tax=Populus alba x Populus x berolinensis TaxID=444605 RepID=A0AAD6LQM8_9ROSI|nr:hypothetical protein NC653_032056 [Populus alba x Populus x berolinensis]